MNIRNISLGPHSDPDMMWLSMCRPRRSCVQEVLQSVASSEAEGQHWSDRQFSHVGLRESCNWAFLGYTFVFSQLFLKLFCCGHDRNTHIHTPFTLCHWNNKYVLFQWQSCSRKRSLKSLTFLDGQAASATCTCATNLHVFVVPEKQKAFSQYPRVLICTSSVFLLLFIHHPTDPLSLKATWAVCHYSEQQSRLSIFHVLHIHPSM